MGIFKIISKTKLADMEIGQTLPESDFSSLTPCGTFVQMEYVDDDKTKEKYEVKPGVWTIQKGISGLKLEATEFNKDSILDEFVHVQNVTSKIDCFFRNLHVYAEHGIEIPKRGVLLYGVPGTGKSTLINKACKKYVADGKTAIVIWSTDRYEAYDVKCFFQSFQYVGVEKIILVVEDIGGVEIANRDQASDSSLLSLLDNKEKTFTLPILILATTNFPQNFMGNLTNRPDRFDDKIEVGYPNGSERLGLLKFFAKREIPEAVVSKIQTKECEKLSPAHIRELVIRSAIYEKDMDSVLNDMLKEIKQYEKGFDGKDDSGKWGLNQ